MGGASCDILLCLVLVATIAQSASSSGIWKNSTKTVFKATAEIKNGGISISCLGCPEGWQNQLKMGNGVGSVPIECPRCPNDWRSYLPQEYSTALPQASQKSTTEDDEYYDEYEDEHNTTTVKATTVKVREATNETYYEETDDKSTKNLDY